MSAIGSPHARIVVVGASRAGLSAAAKLRDEGFDGELVVVGAEPHPPYDRTALSTHALACRSGCEELGLRLDGLDVAWRLGEAATALDLASQMLVVGAQRLPYDGLVIATGSAARRPPDLDGPRVHVLRSLDDAIALRDAFGAGGRLAVVGGGFIGCEVAASARALGLQTTVIETSPAPLTRILGGMVGAAIERRLRAQGVNFRCERTVAAVVPAGVRLDDGDLVEADHVLVAVGATPAVTWLRDSGLPLAAGILCDATCATDAPGVVAAGDVARWHHPGLGRHVRIEHWDNAEDQGAAAARRLLHGPGVEPFAPQPYFWSDQGPHVVRLAGWPDGEPVLVDGSPDEGPLLVAYRTGARVTGVLSIDDLRGFCRLRRRLRQGLAADDLAVGACA